MSEETPTREQIRQWLLDPNQWPNDSYDVETLEPSETQLRRENGLRELLPAWCWEAEPGAAILSIGTGKGYWERKYWRGFDRVYIIDPSQQTRLSLDYFPIHNAQFLGTSLFDQDIHQDPVPKYGWMGASSHYLFGEFFGWEFMTKLALLISDTLVIDAGVFDPDTRHGRVFQDSWKGLEAFELYRAVQFNYDSFRQRIQGLWEVAAEWPTPWIDGRRTLVLKRALAPALQRTDLGGAELVKTTQYWSVYRTPHGYYKETPNMTQLLVYDTVSKVMGWSDLVRYRVFEGERYCGFITRDLGEESPAEPHVSERLFLSLLSWLMPLGLLPADVARENIRMYDGRPVLMDIDLRTVRTLDARQAAWIMTNLYKQYDIAPEDIRGMSRAIGCAPSNLVSIEWPRLHSVA